MTRIFVPSLSASAGSGPAHAAKDMAPSPVESCLWLEGSDGEQCGPQATQEGCACQSLPHHLGSIPGWRRSWVLARTQLGQEPQNPFGSYGLVGLRAGLTYQGPGF